MRDTNRTALPSRKPIARRGVSIKRVRHLPVIEHGELLGIISIGDLVKSIISDREFVIEQLEHYIRGSTR